MHHIHEAIFVTEIWMRRTKMVKEAVLESVFSMNAAEFYTKFLNECLISPKI